MLLPGSCPSEGASASSIPPYLLRAYALSGTEILSCYAMSDTDIRRAILGPLFDWHTSLLCDGRY
eukprot:2666757-Rhodomonas_salina.3